MIVRHLKQTVGTDREVKAPGGQWQSNRLLLAHEGMGFSFHITTIHAHSETYIHYKHHLEAVYCIKGRGEIECIDGETHAIEPGMMYALNLNDAHHLRAFGEPLELACVFNPPISGQEVHGPDGAYPPAEG